MADGDKPKLNTADLKARLGLKARKSPAPAPRPKAAAAAPVPVGEPVVAQPTDASIEAARKAAASASAAAGPAIEDFSMAGAENTPVPAALPGGTPQVEYVAVGAADSYPGGAKKRGGMLLAVALVAGVVAFFLGQLLSGASLQNELRDSYIAEAQEKQALFKTQTKVFDRISALKAKVKYTVEQVDGVRKAGDKDILVLQSTFEELVPVLASYVKDEVLIKPGSVMGTTMYNGELMRQVVGYSVKTELVFQKVKSALGEMSAYLRSAAPPGATTRVVHVATEERTVEGKGAIPTGKGLWIADTGPPALIDFVDERGKLIRQEWQQQVLPEGVKDPIQVPTRTVMSLDLKHIYDDNFKRARRMMIGRMSSVVEELNEMLRGLDDKKLKEAVSVWANKGEAAAGQPGE